MKGKEPVVWSDQMRTSAQLPDPWFHCLTISLHGEKQEDRQLAVSGAQMTTSFLLPSQPHRKVR